MKASIGFFAGRGFKAGGYNAIQKIMIFFTLALFGLTGFTGMAQEITGYSEAVRILAREQSLAESHAGILKEFGRKNIEKYAHGIMLYAEAKADFDGLIEQMRTQMITGQPMEESEPYKKIMTAAAEKRIAFTNFVSKQITIDEPGKKSLPVVFTAAAQLIPVLVDAGKAVYEEYRKAKEQEKKDILDQLSALKWKSFEKIGS